MSTRKLTQPQGAALQAVRDGLIYGAWGIGVFRMKWMRTDHWQAERPQPYESLRKAGLISVASARGHRSDVTLTSAGREILASASKEDQP